MAKVSLRFSVVLSAGLVALCFASATPASAELCARSKPGSSVVVRGECSGAEKVVAPRDVVPCSSKSGKISLKRDACGSKQERVEAIASVCTRPYLVAPVPKTLRQNPDLEGRFDPAGGFEPTAKLADPKGPGFSFSR